MQRYESKQRTSQVSFSAIEESKHTKDAIYTKKELTLGTKNLRSTPRKPSSTQVLVITPNPKEDMVMSRMQKANRLDELKQT